MKKMLTVLSILLLASSIALAASVQYYNDTTVTSNGQIAVLEGYTLSKLLDTAAIMEEDGWSYQGPVSVKGRYGSTYMLTMSAPEGGSHAKGGR